MSAETKDESLSRQSGEEGISSKGLFFTKALSVKGANTLENLERSPGTGAKGSKGRTE